MTVINDISEQSHLPKLMSQKTFYVSFIALFFFAVVVEAIFLATDNVVGAFTWSNLDDLINSLGGVDAANYLRIGKDISDGVLSNENIWILNLWPPGMPVLYTVLIAIPGSVVVKMVIFSSLFWALAGAFSLSLITPSRSKLATIGFLVFWLLISNPYAWTLGNGIMFSDGLGAALLIVFVNLIFLINKKLNTEGNYFNKRIVILSLLAGLSLGLSLTFRWAFVVSVALVSIFSLLCSVYFLLKLSIKHFIGPSGQEQKNYFTVLITISLGIFLAVLPWTIVTQFKLHPGNPTWSMGDYQWGQRWLTDIQLSQANAGFLVEGNANWACEISPEQCIELNKIALSGDGSKYTYLRDEAIKAAIAHPVEYIANRSEVLFRAYFSSPNSKVGSFDSIGYGIVNSLISFSFVFLAIISWKKYKLYVLMATITISGLLIALGIAHVENRYLIPLVSLLGATAFTLLSTRIKPKKVAGSPT